MKLPLERFVPLAFALALLLLVLIGGVSYRNMSGLSLSLDWENHTQIVLTKLDQVLITLVDAETGGRGFLLTGEDPYLEPFNTADQSFPQRLAELRALTADNPAQQQKLDTLNRLAQEKLNLIRKAVVMRREQGLAPILDQPRTHQGKILMDQLRQLIQEMKQDEFTLLHQRGATARAGTSRTMIVILLGSALGVLALALAGLAILREIRRRQTVERALQQANLQLAARVEEQTQALSSTTQELQLENIRRAKAEEAERRQREWWSVTLTSIGDAVITTDTRARVNYLNQTAQQLTGWTQEEAQGQPLEKVFRIVNEETRQPLDSPVASVLRDGARVGLTNHTALLARDGREYPIDNSGAPIRDVDGKTLGAVLIFREVSQQRQAEAERDRLLASRNLLLESAYEGIFGLDLQGCCTFINKAAAQMLGYRQEEVLGQSVHELIHYHRKDGSLYPLEECPHYLSIRAGEAHQIEEDVLWRRDGTWFPALCSSAPQRQNGVIIGAVVNFTDNTERQRVEEERAQLLELEQKARAQAEEANRIKDEFVATVSHELRAPLNAILGWARMLRAGKLAPDTVNKAIETIERSAENQARLIEDLLDISRIVTGKLRLDLHTIDPGAVVRSALEIVGPAAEAKGIKLKAEFDPAMSFINGDSNRLQQVVWNLLSNAIKFTPKAGEINLSISGHDSQVFIRVSDNGQGIPPEFLPHVFDRFRQADSSSIRKHGGLGIGLAVARHLVELHGGTIKAESEGVDKGATFTISLPIMPLRLLSVQNNEAGKSDDWRWATNLEPMLAGLFILVVDDEEDARQLLTQILTAQGATVLAAGSAAEALEIIRQQQPDLLVSDIGMPEEDGYSLIRKIRAQKLGSGGKLPAVALTAYAQTQDRLRALAAGFQQHLSKPVEPAELATVVASLTGRIGSEETN